MAAIDEISGLGITSGLKEIFRQLLWRYIEEHPDDRLKLSFWKFHKTFRVADLYSIWTWLLGPRPIFTKE